MIEGKRTAMECSYGACLLRQGGTGRRFGRRFGAILGLFVTWSARARQRRALAALDERMLKDIGISRAEAAAEAAKPFWQD